MWGRNITVDLFFELIVFETIFFAVEVPFAGTRGSYLVFVLTMNYFIACELGNTFLWGVKGMKVKIVLGFVMSVNFFLTIVVIMLLF